MYLSDQDILFFHIQVSKSRRFKMIMLSLSSSKEILYRISAQSEYNTEVRYHKCSTFKEGNKVQWYESSRVQNTKYLQGRGPPAEINLQLKWSQTHFYVLSSHVNINKNGNHNPK